jgi:hypothetical protein
MGVNWGNNYSGQMFNSGQSLGQSLADAFGGAGNMKRQLLQASIDEKYAHIDSMSHVNDYNDSRTNLNKQEYGGKEQAAGALPDIVRARFGGTPTNTQPSGAAAPVPVDAISNYLSGVTRAGANATDIANAVNHGMGGTGIMFGPQDSQNLRTNFALTGGTPSETTVLGPNDTAGTNAKIAVETVKEGPHDPTSQGLFGKDKPDNVVLNLQPKIDNGTATDQEKLAYKIAMSHVDPATQHGWQNSDGTHSFATLPGVKMSAPTQPQSAPPPPQQDSGAPVVVQPQAPQTDTPFVNRGPVSPIVSSNAPAPVGPADPQPAPQPAPAPTAAPQPNVITLGTPKPQSPNDTQQKTAVNVMNMVDAEPRLRRFDGTNAPSSVAGVLKSLGNQTVGAGFVYDQLQTQSDKDFFDAAFQYLTGKLRTESGASINPSEFASNFPFLFPAAGDSPERVAQKQESRARNIEMQISALLPDQKAIIDGYMRADGTQLHAPPSAPPAAPAAGGGIQTYNPVTGDFE